MWRDFAVFFAKSLCRDLFFYFYFELLCRAMWRDIFFLFQTIVSRHVPPFPVPRLFILFIFAEKNRKAR